MIPSVRIVEVGPRDGLQNEPQIVATDVKRALIHRLAGAGLKHIEATAFVSPKWVPQMADHAALMAMIGDIDGVNFPVLVPNFKGFEAAMASGAREVAVFASASEGFSQKNINCSIAESIDRFVPIFEAARAQNVRVRGYVSCVVACPYDGAIAPAKVADVAGLLFDAGCYEISLGDTIGVGTPASVRRMLEAVAGRVPVERLAGHYHDTYGMGVANAFASWEFGLTAFDSSVAGLGGCPYAEGASGNVATEDLVYLFEGLGVETGIDLPRLVDCAHWFSAKLGRGPHSRVAKALLARTKP
ncbi:hydroxymethylglutaryl-CoA lyase [Jiella sp. MQZ9-1]|uniref:hydroxymethylglutaryl-CoA lyase n=1 Tax=Jiella flava TaxID=2816857 RepID=A0A939JRH1_9HYPH|nr:hydroxymethylglutaryl-CoA lyase [Jiella flava]MBO0661908.1 hydroxymethylglutaryl-CoA lyase [Jiella flava]MCD2470764.1 hydroxymethylglutaryl-CoA lyase [Jiella flava]